MSESMTMVFINPESMAKVAGYSQAVVITKGALVLIAGQVALDKGGNLVGKDNFREQVQQVFANVEAALKAVGCSFRDVVKLNSYFLDFSHVAEFREVRDRYIDLKNPPASTAVQVSRLFRPEFLIEVEAIAVTENLAV